MVLSFERDFALRNLENVTLSFELDVEAQTIFFLSVTKNNFLLREKLGN